MQRFGFWLNNLTLPSDPLHKEQAPLLQILIMGLMAVAIAAMVLTWRSVGAGGIEFAMLTFWLVAYSFALVILRKGHFLSALNTISVALLIGLFLLFMPKGQKTSGTSYLLLALPIILVGVLGTRRMLWTVATATIGLFATITILEDLAPTLVGYAVPRMPVNRGEIISFALVVFLIGLSLDRFSNKQRLSLTTSLQREKDLETLRAQQETIIGERTAHLSTALRDVQQREQQLNHTLAELGAAQSLVRELSIPVLPVLPAVLAVPLVGAIDHDRADILMSNVLAAVVQERAHYVIFDITGVPLVDTQVARVLIETANAIKLMGANVFLVGVQPDVAQTLVSLGTDMQIFTPHPDLRTAIASLRDSSLYKKGTVVKKGLLPLTPN